MSANVTLSGRAAMALVVLSSMAHARVLAEETEANHVALIACDEGAREVAGIFKDRIQRRSTVQIAVSQDETSAAGLRVYLGQAGASKRMNNLCVTHQITLPGTPRPFAEGFALKTVSVNGVSLVVAVGADRRGVLYATGELLRRLHYRSDSVSLGAVDLRAAPAYRFRGFVAGQGGTMRRLTGAREWTSQELKDRLLEHALAGANCLWVGNERNPYYDYVKSFELMTVGGYRPNEMRGKVPNEWRAKSGKAWEGSQWVCPSLPEARAALLRQWGTVFARSPYHDVVRFYAGDPGGCRCPRCRPWGKTFVFLCEDLAKLWLEAHPGSVVQIANQDVDNAGDQAIFDYLNAASRPWLYGICYGPGSNALSSYFRDELREDLFEYPGDGPVNRYLSETLRQLPGDKRIVHYSDITHWISAQYEVAHPEPHLAKVYGRRTFHARPKAFYRIFHQIMPFSEGDIVYSEGYHDEFNEYLWCRLLWDPNWTLEDVTMEYCRQYFGEEAAERMMAALFQLEENLEAPLETNEGIGRYYDLVSEAGACMPPHVMVGNYRWRLHMQKADLDRYVQLRLRIERDKEKRIASLVEEGLTSGRLTEALPLAKAILNETAETEEMTRLREDASRLGDETNALYGVRNEGYPRIGKPLRDLAGLARKLEELAGARSKEDRRAAVESIVKLTQTPTKCGSVFF